MRQAEILFSKGDYITAEDLFAQVGAVKGFKFAEAASMRQARCLYEQEKYAAAGKLYWDIPRRFPETTEYNSAILSGAKCFYLTGDYKTAQSGFEIIAKRDVPEAAEATQWIARSLLKQSDPEQALRVLDQAIRKRRNGEKAPELLIAKADALYDIPARRSEAIRAYSEFAERYPSNEMAPQALYMAALTSLESQQHAEAKSFS
ncbi:MAG: tetratricopeptide repeat protein, partial [Chloroflexi bacterium]|nr:tetratricopeptide repeat protein [Chloroflexota bacterium]